MSRRLIESTVSLGEPIEDGDRLVLWACWVDGEAAPEAQIERLSILRAVLACAEADDRTLPPDEMSSPPSAKQEITVLRADIEALFRDGAGRLVLPGGRGGQATSQTNRYFALLRLYGQVTACGCDDGSEGAPPSYDPGCPVGHQCGNLEERA